MDGSKWREKKCPIEKANIFSKIFFSWMTPFFVKGYKKDLGTEDLYNNRKSDSAEVVGDCLEKEWNKELKKMKLNKKPSLTSSVLRTFAFQYFGFALFAVVGECFTRVMQPLFLGWMVRYYAKAECVPRDQVTFFGPEVSCISSTEAYLSAGGVCLSSALYVLTYHPYFYGMQRTGMRLRVACSNLVYKKALKLSRGSLGKTTVGQMVNLLSNDVNKFDESLIFLPFLFVGPLQTITTLIALWPHLGLASLAGVAVLVLYIPFQGIMAKLFSKLRSKITGLTDERIRLMNETISGMRVIKMYTWEAPFVDLIAESRRKEITKIRNTAVLRGLNIALFFVSAKVILFLAFLTFSLMSQTLTAEIAFVSMSLFNNLRLSMTLFFPYGVSQGAEALISLRRLQRFLLLEEQAETNINKSNLRPKPEQCGVWLDNITGRWNIDSDEPTLTNIKATVKPGELLAVVGSVGSGKSSLLMAALGELPIESGEVKVRGRVAYASQEPWVFTGSVKSNVLFGNEFDEKKYKKVLHVCALDKDIEQLPYGDRTLVGERGVSLSGGQKARVNLARALYYDADVYLLDDPLSAVDAAVAKHLFEKCINGYLKDKTRILVTHQLQFLKQATNICILKHGSIMAIGSYPHLHSSGINLASLMERTEEEKKEMEARRRMSSVDEKSIGSVANAVSSAGVLYESSMSVNSVGLDEGPLGDAASLKEPTELEEGKSTGSVSGGIYWTYIRAGAGPFMLIILIVSNILTQVLFNGSDYWLTIWTEEMKKKPSDSIVPTTNIPEATEPTTLGVYSNFDPVMRSDTVDFFSGKDLWFYVYVYAALTIGVLSFSLIRSVIFFVICMSSSENLHNTMFSSVVRAPISFFDNNPLGRILNRFTKDMGTVDDLLPITALDMTSIFLGLAGTLVLVSTVNYWLTIPSFIMIIVFYYVRKFYLLTARDVKRLEGITRSPVFSHISTTLYGLTTIRAFKAQEMFERQFCYHQDHHTRSWFIVICSGRWLGIVLDWICVVYISAVTAALVLMNADDENSGGNIGLAISSALLLSGSIQWGVRQSAELESQMTSVERVDEYSRLPSEAALEASSDKKPPPDWPQRGDIVFDNMSLIYSPNDPPVLKNLYCKIKSQEKIGIVGRTGAGKSSMISALFRMAEPEGIISIDGIPTKDVGLHDLRSKISIIPQDPVLFTGPVRRNIDPFGKSSDAQLWNVLEEVQLKEVVEHLPGGLDTFLSEGGSNFSVGQRQLVCMARAILRNNKILVLDEATANVDARTDSLIQRTIREKFRTCTVLTIAHRLNTIMDCDRVLVLDAGRIQEFDEPYILLQNELGVFYDMVQKTGPAMAEQLKAVARQTSEARAKMTDKNKGAFAIKNQESLKKHQRLRNSLRLNEAQVKLEVAPVEEIAPLEHIGNGHVEKESTNKNHVEDVRL